MAAADGRTEAVILADLNRAKDRALAASTFPINEENPNEIISAQTTKLDKYMETYNEQKSVRRFLTEMDTLGIPLVNRDDAVSALNQAKDAVQVARSRAFEIFSILNENGEIARYIANIPENLPEDETTIRRYINEAGIIEGEARTALVQVNNSLEPNNITRYRVIAGENLQRLKRDLETEIPRIERYQQRLQRKLTKLTLLAASRDITSSLNTIVGNLTASPNGFYDVLESQLRTLITEILSNTRSTVNLQNYITNVNTAKNNILGPTGTDMPIGPPYDKRNLDQKIREAETVLVNPELPEGTNEKLFLRTAITNAKTLQNSIESIVANTDAYVSYANIKIDNINLLFRTGTDFRRFNTEIDTIVIPRDPAAINFNKRRLEDIIRDINVFLTDLNTVKLSAENIRGNVFARSLRRTFGRSDSDLESAFINIIKQIDARIKEGKDLINKANNKIKTLSGDLSSTYINDYKSAVEQYIIAYGIFKEAESLGLQTTADQYFANVRNEKNSRSDSLERKKRIVENLVSPSFTNNREIQKIEKLLEDKTREIDEKYASYLIPADKLAKEAKKASDEAIAIENKERNILGSITFEASRARNKANKLYDDARRKVFNTQVERIDNLRRTLNEYIIGRNNPTATAVDQARYDNDITITKEEINKLLINLKTARTLLIKIDLNEAINEIIKAKKDLEEITVKLDNLNSAYSAIPEEDKPKRYLAIKSMRNTIKKTTELITLLDDLKQRSRSNDVNTARSIAKVNSEALRTIYSQNLTTSITGSPDVITIFIDDEIDLNAIIDDNISISRVIEQLDIQINGYLPDNIKPIGDLNNDQPNTVIGNANLKIISSLEIEENYRETDTFRKETAITAVESYNYYLTIIFLIVTIILLIGTIIVISNVSNKNNLGILAIPIFDFLILLIIGFYIYKGSYVLAYRITVINLIIISIIFIVLCFNLDTENIKNSGSLGETIKSISSEDLNIIKWVGVGGGAVILIAAAIGYFKRNAITIDLVKTLVIIAAIFCIGFLTMGILGAIQIAGDTTNKILMGIGFPAFTLILGYGVYSYISLRSVAEKIGKGIKASYRFTVNSLPKVWKFLLAAVFIVGPIALIVLSAINKLSSDEGTSLLLVSIFSVLLFLILVSITFLGLSQITSLLAYAITFVALIVGLVYVSLIENSTLRTVCIIALSILLFVTTIIGGTTLYSFITGKYDSLPGFYKNPFGLNPTIQLDKIRAWGFTSGMGGIIILVLTATVTMLFISGVNYIDVYENLSDESHSQTFGRSFSLIWGIFNFVVGAWIAIQTVYFIKVVFDMIKQERADKCKDIIYNDHDNGFKDGYPVGEFKNILDNKYKLAYINEKELKGITDYGIIDDNGVYIPKEFLDEDGVLRLEDPTISLAFTAYMDRYKKKYKDGKFTVYEDGFIKNLLETTKSNLKASKAPYEIKDQLLSELKIASKKGPTYDIDKLKEVINKTKKTTKSYN